MDLFATAKSFLFSKMSKKAKFQVNENVWACDQEKFYPAKVLRHESLGPVNKYFVHYSKWDRKYDTWLDEKLLEPWNNGLSPVSTTTGTQGKVAQKKGKGGGKKNGDINIAVEEEIKKDVEVVEEKVDEETADATPLEFPITRRSRKRKEVENSFELASESDPVRPLPTTSTKTRPLRPVTQSDLIQDSEEHTYHIKFTIPNDLKRHMVDEWMIITQEKPGRLLKLPKAADKNVKTLLRHYLDDRKQKFDDAQMRNAKELVSALIPFFDKALPSILLYRQERAQYDALMEKFPSGRPSEIYGGEHFVRLYVRLPRFMSSLFGPQIQTVHANLVDLLKFIFKNSSQYISIHNYASDEDAMDIKVAPAVEATETDDAEESASTVPKKRGRPAWKPKK